jgi:hypothetical protein
VQRQWLADRQLTPGAPVFDWQRRFTLWGYTGSHSVVLFRSVKAEPDEEGPTTRIDLVFKPVKALSIRTSYRTLAVRVACQERADQVLSRLGKTYPDDRVLELVGPDGTSDHIVCTAVGCHEDGGENGEPSPFAMDLADGRTPPWRARVLGGGPDGDLTARVASLDEVTAAVRADAPRPPGGRRGRYLFVVMMRWTGRDEAPSRATALAAFLTRDEAEEYLRASGGGTPDRYEYWVDVVPMDL